MNSYLVNYSNNFVYFVYSCGNGISFALTRENADKKSLLHADYSSDDEGLHDVFFV